MSDPLYSKARQQVNKKKRFYRHFSVYLAVGVFFLAMNLLTFNDGREWWFFFPMLPWGVGLLIHYFSVFGLPGVKALTPEWEEKELQREMERLRRQNRMAEGGALPELDAPKEPDLDLPELDKMKEKQKRWDEDELV